MVINLLHYWSVELFRGDKHGDRTWSLACASFLESRIEAPHQKCGAFRKLHIGSYFFMIANDLQVAVKQHNDATVLSVSGRVSVDSSPMLRNRLLAVLRSVAAPSVIVDLTETPYIDCSGVATLVEALKTARNRNIALRVTGLQGRIKNLFEITGVLGLFEGRSHATVPSISKEC